MKNTTLKTMKPIVSSGTTINPRIKFKMNSHVHIIRTVQVMVDSGYYSKKEAIRQVQKWFFSFLGVVPLIDPKSIKTKSSVTKIK